MASRDGVHRHHTNRMRLTRLLFILMLFLPAFARVQTLSPAAAAASTSTTASPSSPSSVTVNAPPSGLRLDLTWSTSAARVGVPLDLSIDRAGSGSNAATSAVTLVVSDMLAQLNGAFGAATTGGASFTVTLYRGHAVAPIVFHTPGQVSVLAQLVSDPTVAGESPALVVQDTFLSLTLPTTTVAGQLLPLTVVAHDDRDQPVTGYVGTVDVVTSDAQAQLGAGLASASARLEHTFTAAEAGQTSLTIQFVHPGAQTVTAVDAIDPSSRSVQTIMVAAPSSQATLSGADVLHYATATPSFHLSWNSASTNAGVPLTLTVQALDANGVLDPSYRGTVQLTSTDPAWGVSPGTRYTFTSTDAGQHTFTVTFNTAGSAQTVTATDTVQTSMTGTSPAVTVVETVFVAHWALGTVAQSTTDNLTVQAQDGQGHTLTGYRGTVVLSATWNSVSYWGTGVPASGVYTFTSTDAGQHVFGIQFRSAGTQTVTVTDQAMSSRTVTTDAVVVTNAPAGSFAHDASPSGVELPDGSTIWAYLGQRGRLYVRRNVGTTTDPAWRPAVIVRQPANGIVGADTPSLVLFGTTLALFHSYSDGTYYQIWLTTSNDEGATWSTPVQLTHETGHVQRIQTVVDGDTLYLFWSRQDTDQHLYYETTTDLTTWSAKATVGQAIGVPVLDTTSNFGITKLASGQWLLGWLWTSTVNEYPWNTANNLTYPTVHTALSTDLVGWSGSVELNLPYSQRWPTSVSLAQQADTGQFAATFEGTGQIEAAFEQYVYPWDTYLVTRSSIDGITWAPQTVVGYDHSAPADGWQGYSGKLPTLVAGGTVVAGSVEVAGGHVQPYGHGSWENADSGRAVVSLDLNALSTEPTVMPPGDPLDPPECPTGRCAEFGYPVNAITGYESAHAVDLTYPAIGLPVVVSRSYTSNNGLHGTDGPFGPGWSWSYGTHALTFVDGSVAIVEGDGTVSRFWAQGGSWTPGANVTATLAAGPGGGYLLTRHDQTVWRFESSGQLISITDPNGNTQTLTYSNGVLTSITAAGGWILTVTTTNGHITQISGPGGLHVDYAYDGTGNLQTATDVTGATTTYSYDSRHQLVTVVDGNQHTAETNTYGSLGRVTQQQDAANQVTTFSYGFQGYAGSFSDNLVTDPRGNQIHIDNDASSRITRRQVWTNGGRTIYPATVWSYDHAGDVTQYIDGNGVVTNATYDSHSNLLTLTQDAGTFKLNVVSSFVYDSRNDLLSATDPLNHTTTYTYDTAGNLLTATDALQHSTSYGYDPLGELTSATDALNRTTNLGYNGTGELTTITEPGSLVTTLAYDPAGHLASITDPLNHGTTLAVNNRGQVTGVTDALNHTTSYGYDAIGNRTSVTDADNHTTTYAYDTLNRLVTSTDALQHTTTYSYDADSNVTGITDANNHTTRYSYDGLNRPTAVTDALNRTTSYGYDGAGNVTQTVDANGITNGYV